LPYPCPTPFLQDKEKALADKETALNSTQDRLQTVQTELDEKLRMLQGISQVRCPLLGFGVGKACVHHWISGLQAAGAELERVPALLGAHSKPSTCQLAHTGVHCATCLL